ncbi:amino acid racemase [Aestuariirhabdus sp. Z084]|uniref:aspartate/glutamate racemase family protein n=1 Tax=Aestuariirhabdus haliotis TaxID=2918751 RepID=UPI00201B3C24|nr:amino acid racemase [Aestuariirhabdus haliotis]MCL6415722.1 amino acid racemase [Aestuariirhabdus haliotis]MCL6419752.1 amino acid racemase [Aestuariirhabdus haliotis]
MSLHIGIVGCSAEGAALCYKTICTEAPKLMGPHEHPEITLHTPSLARYVDCLNTGDIEGVGSLMLESAHILANAGADFLICPDNTIHQAFDWVAERSPLPWIHIANVVAREAVFRGYKKVGITGTSWLVRSSVYPDALARQGLDFARPNQQQIEQIGNIIMSQLVYSDFRPESVRYFQSVIDDLKQQACDAVVLGCTEIPLIINDTNASLPTLDSTRLLARAALDKAIGKQ